MFYLGNDKIFCQEPVHFILQITLLSNFYWTFLDVIIYFDNEIEEDVYFIWISFTC